MIQLVVVDIDGVVTDGSVTIDAQGNELKKMNMKDVDALFELHRRGFRLAAITGEDTRIVSYFEKRFPWAYFFRGSKTKKEAMQLIEQLDLCLIVEQCNHLELYWLLLDQISLKNYQKDLEQVLQYLTLGMN